MESHVALYCTQPVVLTVYHHLTQPVYRDILIEESNVQRVQAPVTVCYIEIACGCRPGIEVVAHAGIDLWRHTWPIL